MRFFMREACIGFSSLALAGVLWVGGSLVAAEGDVVLEKGVPGGQIDLDGIDPIPEPNLQAGDNIGPEEGGPPGDLPAGGADGPALLADVGGGIVLEGEPGGEIGPENPVGGPGIGGPEGGPGIGGADIGGPAGDVPAGPVMVHHFVHAWKIPGYYGRAGREMREIRMDLILFDNGEFVMKTPARGRDSYRGRCGPGEAPSVRELTGLWKLDHDELALEFERGYVDFGLLTISKAGPMLRYEGHRWTDILAVQ